MVSKLHLNALTGQASIWTFINMVRGAMTALYVCTFTATRETWSRTRGIVIGHSRQIGFVVMVTKWGM